jgi:hypothetical protein
MPAKRPAPRQQDSQLSLFDVAPEITPAEPGAPRSRRELWLGQHRVGYELKRARRRSIGFVVGPQGLRVSAPRWVPIGEIERALHHKGFCASSSSSANASSASRRRASNGWTAAACPISARR